MNRDQINFVGKFATLKPNFDTLPLEDGFGCNAFYGRGERGASDGFPYLLLNAVYDFVKEHPSPTLSVSFIGFFPRKHIDEAEVLFNLYAKATRTSPDINLRCTIQGDSQDKYKMLSFGGSDNSISFHITGTKAIDVKNQYSQYFEFELGYRAIINDDVVTVERKSDSISKLVIEVLCNLVGGNKAKFPVNVCLLGEFPKLYVDWVETLFSMYAKAEGVRVETRYEVRNVSLQRGQGKILK